MLEQEQLKIISDCSNRLVQLSLRNEKEEKERREAINKEAVKGREKKEALNNVAKEKHDLADKKVIIFYKSYCVRNYFSAV